MYKMEPVVADGGEVIIYAPHITEVSYTHGKILDQIGYHCRDYFLKQWDKFKQFPHGVLAHSTHLRGLGTYDAVTGIENPAHQGNPGDRNSRRTLPAHWPGLSRPGSLNPDNWTGMEDKGILVVPRAGEMLYRLRDPQGNENVKFEGENNEL